MLHPLPSPPFRHSKSQAAITSPLQRETPPSSIRHVTTAQPEPLPRRCRPPQHLDVPRPPPRMRIRRPSRRPAGLAAPSSTSKELLRRPPRLSRLLHPHSAALTCSTGTATSSPTPRTKPRPTQRHQRGCTLIASHLLLNLTSRHRRCSIPHPHEAATSKPAPRATSPWRLSPVRGPFGSGVHTSRICCCCSGSRSLARAAAAALALARSLARPAAAAALPLARAAALLRFSYTSFD